MDGHETQASILASPGAALARRARHLGPAVAVHLVFAAFCCLLNLGGYPLISMEPMVAEGGAAMLEDGDWAVPHVYGEVFTFKPALAYWLSALAQLPDGQPGELLLRLPFALSGVALGLAVLLLLSRVAGPRVGLLAAMAAVGSTLFLEKVRIAEYDTPLALGVAVATVAALVNLTQREESAPLWALCYLGLATGFAAKGAPALMAFAPGLLLAALLVGRLRRLFGWRHLVGGAVGLLLIGGYLWWAYDSGGSQVFDQPRREALVRGLRWGLPELLRTAAKPLLAGLVFLPWSLAIFLWRPFWRSAGDRRRRLAMAGAGFAVAGIVVFCLLPRSEPRYLLPLVTPVAVLAGLIVATLLERRIPAWPVMLCRGLLGLAVALTLGTAVSRGAASWIVLGACLLLLTAVGFRGEARAGSTLLGTLVALSLVIAVAQSLVFAPGRAAKRDLSGVAARFSARLPAGEPVWVFGPADCAGYFGPLLHYLRRDVTTLPDPGAAEPGTWGVLIDWQPELIPAGVSIDVMDTAAGGGYDFHLVRVRENPLAASARDASVPRVGDLCFNRYTGTTVPERRPPWTLPAGLEGAPQVPDPAANLSY